MELSLECFLRLLPASRSAEKDLQWWHKEPTGTCQRVCLWGRAGCRRSIRERWPWRDLLTKSLAQSQYSSLPCAPSWSKIWSKSRWQPERSFQWQSEQKHANQTCCCSRCAREPFFSWGLSSQASREIAHFCTSTRACTPGNRQGKREVNPNWSSLCCQCPSWTPRQWTDCMCQSKCKPSETRRPKIGKRTSSSHFFYFLATFANHRRQKSTRHSYPLSRLDWVGLLRCAADNYFLPCWGYYFLDWLIFRISRPVGSPWQTRWRHTDCPTWKSFCFPLFYVTFQLVATCGRASLRQASDDWDSLWAMQSHFWASWWAAQAWCTLVEITPQGVAFIDYSFQRTSLSFFLLYIFYACYTYSLRACVWVCVSFYYYVYDVFLYRFTKSGGGFDR